jgi:hypothetical protein
MVSVEWFSHPPSGASGAPAAVAQQPPRVATGNLLSRGVVTEPVQQCVFLFCIKGRQVPAPSRDLLVERGSQTGP